MKAPKANTSPEAVALREAAILFGKCVADRAVGDFDKKGQSRNSVLLDAAVAYASVANPDIQAALDDAAELVDKLTTEWDHATLERLDQCRSLLRRAGAQFPEEG